MSEERTEFFSKGVTGEENHQMLIEIIMCGESAHYLFEAPSVHDAMRVYRSTDKPFINMPGSKVTFERAADMEQGDKIYASISVNVDEDLLDVYIVNYTSECDRDVNDTETSYISRYALSDYLNTI